MGRFSLVLLIVAGLLSLNGCDKKEQKEISRDQTITILWAKMKVTDALQELTHDFTRKTGIKVHVVQEPWATFQTVFFKEMDRKGTAYDLVGGDSQWLGLGAAKGHYIELTRWIKEQRIDESMAGIAMKWFSEYPQRTGRYWSVPLNGDALSFAYRKDLFENPQEKVKFRTRYGYELAVPETWAQFRDIAEFFTRPEDDLYGVAIWTSEDYDGTTMGVETVIWAWGGDLGDQKTHKVKGYLDSRMSIDGLKFYKELYKFHPPQFPDVYFKSLDLFMSGKVAMTMTYFAVNPTLADPVQNPYANVTGYFSSPRGPKARVTALAGQGLSVISYSKKKDLVFKFLEWFSSEEVQVKWVQSGGLSCNRNVMKSEAFLKAAPYNGEFAKSMEFVRDFWADPEYVQLLTLSQKNWHQYILTDTLSAKEVMVRIAHDWERIFEEAGYYKE